MRMSSVAVVSFSFLLLSGVASTRADQPTVAAPRTDEVVSNPSTADASLANPLINYAQFQNIVHRSGEPRELHRLTEQQFLDDLEDPGTIVLDARSAAMFRLRHVKGAVNLPFTDFTADSLARAIPRRDAQIVIYCNNNFTGSPIAFASKAPAASLNLSTYTSLVAYGYTNVYELGPLLDVRSTRIPFEGLEVAPSSDGQPVLRQQAALGR